MRQLFTLRGCLLNENHPRRTAYVILRTTENLIKILTFKIRGFNSFLNSNSSIKVFVVLIIFEMIWEQTEVVSLQLIFLLKWNFMYQYS